MISYGHAIVLGLLQGISELFPVSSLGHSVIIPQLLGWKTGDEHGSFLTFIVTTHLATALVLLGFYWKEWVAIIKGMGRTLVQREITDKEASGKLGWLLIVGTLPTAVIGLLFKDQLQAIFNSGRSAAFFLILNGLLLYGAELLRRKSAKRTDIGLARLSWSQAFGVGLSQILALIPGFSRSGATMSGGLTVGLSHEESVHFAFLLATPIIFGASLVKLPELFLPANQGLIGPSLVGAAFAALGAYFAVRFLVQYVQTKKLTPFAIYCIIAGILSSLVFFVKA
jgi:undecaprenyl-diphosphatase